MLMNVGVGRGWCGEGGVIGVGEGGWRRFNKLFENVRAKYAYYYYHHHLLCAGFLYIFS
jgi:hypothetical protein